MEKLKQFSRVLGPAECEYIRPIFSGSAVLIDEIQKSLFLLQLSIYILLLFKPWTTCVLHPCLHLKFIALKLSIFSFTICGTTKA